MSVAERSLILEVCSRCGEVASASTHGHTNADWEWLKVEYVPVEQSRGDVKVADVVAWLRGRTGAHGGGFTSADDVADAIEREFGGQ